MSDRTSITDDELNKALERVTPAGPPAGPPDQPEDLAILADLFNEPPPAPVLWRDQPNKVDGGDDDNASEPGRDVVGSVSEPAILTAPGKSGKSFVALELALAAAVASVRKESFGTAAGLRVRAGATVIRSYEDRPVRIAHRLKAVAQRWGKEELASVDELQTAIRLVKVSQKPRALATPGESRVESVRLAPEWRPFWLAVEAAKPSLVVLDPLSALAGGANLNDGGTARFVVEHIADESERHDAGVLIISHDTKAARSQAKAGGDPGAGAGAGSGTWHDAARGVLYLYKNPTKENSRMLRCLAANHGRDGWGAMLTGVPGEPFTGFSREGDMMIPEAVDDELASWREAQREADEERQGKQRKRSGSTRREKPYN